MSGKTNLQNGNPFTMQPHSRNITWNPFRRLTVLTKYVASTWQRSFHTPGLLRLLDQESLLETYNSFLINPRPTDWLQQRHEHLLAPYYVYLS